MSILLNATDVVIVYVGEETVDSYGNRRIEPSSNGVEVSCAVSQKSANDDRVTSRVQDVFKIMTSDLTVDQRWMRVRYNNRWFTVEDWKLLKHSATTQHIEATLREEA
jgi:hypothetical protein